MGSSMSSSSKERSDQLLLDALRGRQVDLPGGGMMFFSVVAGNERSVFHANGETSAIVLCLLGSCVIAECERSFTIYKCAKTGTIYGREDSCGLHILAQNIKALLCKVGISNIDNDVLMGKYFDKQCRSPDTRRSKFSDSMLGRSRGVSVDRRRDCDTASRPQSRNADRKDNRMLSSFCRQEGKRRSFSGASRVNGGARAEHNFNRRPSSIRCPKRDNHVIDDATPTSKVRFGSIVLFGESDYDSENDSSRWSNVTGSKCKDRRSGRDKSAKQLKPKYDDRFVVPQPSCMRRTSGAAEKAKSRPHSNIHTSSYSHDVNVESAPPGYKLLSPPVGNKTKASSFNDSDSYGDYCDEPATVMF